MAVHGGAGEIGPTLIDLLQRGYPDPTSLHLVHRLDRPTSGVMVLAKSKSGAKAIQAAWESARKIYLAIALGILEHDTVIDRALEDRAGRARAAKTTARVLAHLTAVEPRATYLAVRIETGRTHQIRLHLKGLGHPVLMDDQHGDFAANKAWSRAIQARGAPRPKHLMLHSHRLDFLHPGTKRRIRLSENPPESWARVLEAALSPVDGLHQVP